MKKKGEVKKDERTRNIWFVAIVMIIMLSYSIQQNVLKNKMSDIQVVNMTIKDIELSAEVVKNPDALRRGLGDKDRLPPLSAMLFVFDVADKHGIWMKDMEFPIDVFWLDADFKVVDIKKNMGVNTFPNVFYPQKDATYVVETNAGMADGKNVNIGDTFAINI